jgi:hypothetical protein
MSSAYALTDWRMSHNWLNWVWVSVSQVSLILRPTVSWPVSLRIKHSSGVYEQMFTTVGQLQLCWCGTLSLTRGQFCRLQLLLALASAVILGSESPILLSQIRDFLFVASYDSQGYGGRFRPRLHTWYWLNWVWVLYYDRRSVDQTVLE